MDGRFEMVWTMDGSVEPALSPALGGANRGNDTRSRCQGRAMAGYVSGTPGSGRDGAGLCQQFRRVLDRPGKPRAAHGHMLHRGTITARMRGFVAGCFRRECRRHDAQGA